MEQLGIEPKLLLAQVVNFAIIIVVLTKLLYKPILEQLAKRRKEIEDGLVLTETLRLEEEKMAQKREKMLTSTREQSRQLIEEAKGQAKEVEKDIISQAHADAAKILEKGRIEAAQLKEQVFKDLRKAAVELALSMAKRLLSRVISAKDQHHIISQHLKELTTLEEH